LPRSCAATSIIFHYRSSSHLKNSGAHEVAAAITTTVSTRTTQLYDRPGDQVSLDEIELARN
jgi:hypothetical protein